MKKRLRALVAVVAIICIAHSIAVAAGLQNKDVAEQHGEMLLECGCAAEANAHDKNCLLYGELSCGNDLQDTPCNGDCPSCIEPGYGGSDADLGIPVRWQGGWS